MKDYFSTQADFYAAYRPVYPQVLYDFIFRHLTNFEKAWDCGTGNGQVAAVLAKKFSQVVASDISEKQLSKASSFENVTYIKSAEELPSDYIDYSFDLITVAQAIHWFDFQKFYQQVRVSGRPKSLIAVWGYSLLSINKEIDLIVFDFYENKIGPYWDQERQLLVDHYRTIPFPFEEIKTPEFSIATQWSLQQLEGYLNSWSSVQKYITTHRTNPVPEVIEKLKPIWDKKKLAVNFPVFLRLGKVH